MNQLYIKARGMISLMLLLLLTLTSGKIAAQTTLVAGDISIIGINGNNPDDFAFVTWVPLSQNTVIRFTDNGFSGSNQSTSGVYRDQEQYVTWRNNTGGTIAAGTVISISTSVALNTMITSTGEIVSVTNANGGTTPGMALLNTSGDQIFAFQGTGGTNPGNNPVSDFSGTLIFGIGYSGSIGVATGWVTTGTINGSTSYLPTTLAGTSNIFLGPNYWGGQYTGSRTGQASLAAYKALVANPASWNKISTGQVTLDLTSFSAGAIPTITGNPTNKSTCPGNTVTFTGSATDANTYQWEVSTGSTFTALTNTAPYSGVTTTTLTITDVTSAMNGYQYRMVATGTGGPANTTAATLNVSAAAVSGTTVITNVSCNGGSNGAINLTPSGGVGPYTFNWGGSPAVTTEDRTGLAAGNYSVVITDANGCTATVNATVTQPTQLSATTVVTNIACYGSSTGAINLTPSGGVSPYTFNWGGSPAVTTEDRTGLAAGNYSVTITDANGCTRVINVTVAEVATATVSGTTVVTNVSCNGGSNGAINLTPSGGTGPYTFNWGGSPAVTTEDRTGLAAGSYSVIITDSYGCTATVNATVTQPTLLSTTQSQTNVSCNGGSNGTASVTVSGGTPGYTYSWSPTGGNAATATGLTAGTYTVTVTDANACTATQSFTITQPTAALGGTATKTDVSCNGGSNGTASVSVTGGTTPYSYSWSPSGGTSATATGLATGTYTVTVTDFNGCQISRSVTVNQPATALGGTASKTDVSCNNGSNGTASVSVTGGTTPYSYSWSPSGGTNATATGLSTGTYTVTVTDFNGCQITRTATVNQPTALVASLGGQTNISCNGGANGTATVAVIGGAGAYTYSWSPSGGTAATASGLSAGTYTVTVTDANSCQATQSFTITEPSVLETTPSQTNISCNGGTNGSATVSVTGGTLGYTYSWSPSGGTAATASGLAAGTYTVTVTDANACTVTQSFTITQPTALTITPSQTNISCNGGTNGTATVAVTGGAGAYTYSWSPTGGNAATASGLSAGTYTVTVTDANACTATQSFTITEPSVLETTPSQTNISCNGGSNGTATVSVTGGTPGYTYSWSPSGGTAATASGLSAGTYTVTVTDANACTVTQSFTIAQPSALVASASSQTNVSCNGGTNGSATVSVTGGTGTYTYSWSPTGGTAATASGLGAGTYTVTVTDANNCQATQSFTITQPTVLTATTSQTNIACNGDATGSASVTVSGGTPGYTYSWSPSGGTAATASGLVAGNYTVTITDANGCFITRSFVITQAAAINISQQPIAISVTEGANAIFSVVATNATGYQWEVSTNGTVWSDVSNGGTNPVYSGATTSTLTLTNVPEAFDGYLYRVKVSNSATCFVNSDAVELAVTPDLKVEDFSRIGVTIYPNPASTQVFVKIPEISIHRNCSVDVYDLNGRLIIQKRLASESESVDIAHLPSGVYIFNISSDTAKTTKRVVKY